MFRPDRRDDGESKAIMPVVVGGDDLFYFRAALVRAGGRVPAGELARKLSLGFTEGLQKGWIVRDLVAAQAGFLIDNQFLDEDGLADALVASLDFGDGAIGKVDLPCECSGSQQEREDGNKKNLAQDAIETCGIQ